MTLSTHSNATLSKNVSANATNLAAATANHSWANYASYASNLAKIDSASSKWPAYSEYASQLAKAAANHQP